MEPIQIYLGGRATTQVRGERVPVEEIAGDAVRRWLGQYLPRLDLERDLRIHCQVHPGSQDLTQLFQRGRLPLANDTSLGVGHAPPSELEQLVLATEAQLNSEEFRRAHPEAGIDVKIAALRCGSEVSLTVARAFIGGELRGLSDYLEAKAVTVRCAEQVARDRGLAIDVLVNAADAPERGDVYLTVLGTSAESGDDGQVGRGNRANGLITPHRPMTLEALAGKNPISHVGKLYNVLAREIATDVVASFPEVKAAYCYMLSQIGSPIDDPKLVQLEVQTAAGRSLKALAEPMERMVRNHLSEIAQLSQRIIDGRVRLF